MIQKYRRIRKWHEELNMNLWVCGLEDERMLCVSGQRIKGL